MLSHRLNIRYKIEKTEGEKRKKYRTWDLKGDLLYKGHMIFHKVVWLAFREALHF